MDQSFLTQLQSALNSGADKTAALQNSLSLLLSHFNSETGTIHRFDSATRQLHLVAQIGLPPQMLDFVRVIPEGKGIAGQTVARGEPVTICNLQTDQSGVAKPGAKQTGVGGALCVPIRHGNSIVGTLGIGTRREHQYTPVETANLESIAGLLAPGIVVVPLPPK